MAEKQHHGFASRELHWLSNPLGYSQVLRKNTLMHNLLTMPSNLYKGTPENSPTPSPDLAKSYGEPPKRKGNNLFRRVSDATLGIAFLTALAPIERVSILMQCQNEMIKAGRLSTPYKGMTDCLLRTIKHEGVVSLCRGNSINVIKICMIEAAPFVLVHLPYKNYMKKMEESPMWLASLYLMPLMLCRYSLDYAQVRLATDVKAPDGLKFSLGNNIGKRQFSGILDVYKKTLKLDGIRGPFRGFPAFGIGVWAYCRMSNELDDLLYIGFSKERLNQKKPTKLAVMALLVMTCTLPVVKYPFNTVSRRMMMTSASREASKYKSTLHAFYQIVKKV